MAQIRAVKAREDRLVKAAMLLLEKYPDRELPPALQAAYKKALEMELEIREKKREQK